MGSTLAMRWHLRFRGVAGRSGKGGRGLRQQGGWCSRAKLYARPRVRLGEAGRPMPMPLSFNDTKG